LDFDFVLFKNVFPLFTGQVTKQNKKLKAFMDEQMLGTIRNAGVKPLLLVAQADHTPATLKERHTFNTPVGSFVREGGQRFELFLQRYWLVEPDDGNGKPEVSCALREPMCFPDKCNARAFEAFMSFIPWLPDLRCGAAAISILSFVFDRGLCDWLGRWISGYAQYMFDHRHFATNYARELARWTVWTVCVACAEHDCQNALKWALIPMLSAGCNVKLLYKNLHKAVAGVRDSFGYFTDHIHGWVADVQWREVSMEDQCHYYELWCVLGVPWELATLLARLGLDYSGETLWCNIENQHDEDIYETIAGAIMGVLLWRKFAETRWASVGTAMRPAVAGMILGLDSLVRYIRALPHLEYHISNWDLFDDECRPPELKRIQLFPKQLMQQYFYKLLKSFFENTKLIEVRQRRKEYWTVLTFVVTQV